MEYRAGSGIGRIEGNQPGTRAETVPGLWAIGTASIRIADENPLRLVSGPPKRSMPHLSANKENSGSHNALIDGQTRAPCGGVVGTRWLGAFCRR